MKVRFFDVDTNLFPTDLPEIGPQSFTVPGLDAYAIAYATVEYNGVSNPADGREFHIEGNVVTSKETQLQNSDTLVLVVHYHGIRDYSLLFPSVKISDPIRAERMGQFYQESDACFDAGAWLSFMLMAGAIFEHLLFHRLNNPSNLTTLCKLSQAARDQGLITNADFRVIDDARKTRNVIHCNRMSEPYITRKQAMDAKSLIERLMLKM